MRTAYRCRFYPTPEQAGCSTAPSGVCATCGNQVLAWRGSAGARNASRRPMRGPDRFLTGLKQQPEHGFLGEVSCVPLQQALRHQHAAMTAFWRKRARYPRFKARQGRQAASYTRSGFRLARRATVPAKQSGPLRWCGPGRTSIRQSRSVDGECVAGVGRPLVRALAGEVEAPEPAEPMAGPVGVGPRVEALRRAVERGENRPPEAHGDPRTASEALPADPGPQAEGFEQPPRGQAAGGPRAFAGS